MNRNQVTGENAIDFVEFSDDPLAEHTRVFVFTLAGLR